MTQALVNKIITNHFEQQVQQLLGWPIAWPNAEFTPPHGGSYLMIHVMPVQREIIDIQAMMKRYQGAAQISVVVPPGEGYQNAVTAAEIVASMFTPDQVLSDAAAPGFTLCAVSHPTVFDGNDFDGGYMVPVSFEYEAH